MSSTVTTWQRLEPRVRRWDFRENLSAPTYDAAWMIARQWQLGEFIGQDLGTPIQATYTLTGLPLSRFAPGELSASSPGDAIDYSPTSKPLEALVEREELDFSSHFDVFWMVVAADHFFMLMHEELSDVKVEEYRAHLRDELGGIVLSASDWLDDRRTSQLVRAMIAEDTVDGRLLYEALRDELDANGNQILSGSDLLVSSGDASAFTNVAVAWRSWLEDGIEHVSPNEKVAWQAHELTHAFTLGAASSRQYVLEGRHPGNTSLDWYRFELKGDAQGVGTHLGAANNTQTLNASLVPVSVQFPGMPQARFWEFEDGQVAVAAVEARTTQIARNLWMEFMLVFSDEWWVLPVALPSPGMLVEPGQVVVTDTFGQTRTIQPLDQTPGAFRLFDLHRADFDASSFEQLLMLAPSLPGKRSRETLERVSMLPDEAANLAWAIEHAVAGRAGQKVDRKEAWSRNRVPPEEPVGEGLSYRLSTEVPDFWYPLVPEAIGGGNEEVELQLGELMLPSQTTQPDPTSLILLHPAPEQLRAHLLPRQGIMLERAWNMGRWFAGKAHVWSGKHRQLGKWEGTSGLEFDSLIPKKPASPAEEELSTEEGLGKVRSRYPWSLFTVPSQETGDEIPSMLGPDGDSSLFSPDFTTLTTVRNASGAMLFDGSYSIEWLSEDLDLDYIHKYGIFSIVVVASRHPGSGDANLLGNSSDASEPGFRLRYAKSPEKLLFDLSDGTSFHTITPSQNVFAGGGVATVVITSDGETVTFYGDGVQLGQLDLTSITLISEDAQEFSLGASLGAGPRWTGSVGLLGVMPRKLSATEVTELTNDLAKEVSHPTDAWMWFDGADPTTLFTSGGSYATSGQAITSWKDKGRTGLSLSKIPGGDAAGTITRLATGGVDVTPGGSSTNHGMTLSLPEPVSDDAITVICAFKTDAAGTGHPLVGFSDVAGGSIADGIQFEVTQSESGVLVGRDEVNASFEFDEPDTSSSTQIWASTFASSEELKSWLGVHPLPQITAPDSPPSFQGTWNADFATLRLLQRDDVVWGDYGTNGYIQGRVDLETKVLDGIFYNEGADRFGRIKWTLEGDSFDGLWAWDENEPNLNWDGTRTSSTAPTLLEWPSNPPTFEGTWSSTYLTLRFFQAGRRVWGDYGTRGWMQGEIDLDTGILEGTFYNSLSDRYGRIRYTLNGTNTAFTGLWAWDDNEPSMTWNGTRTSSATPTLITWPAWRDGADLVEMNVMARRADGLQFEGEFYELLVWDRTLSEEEVFEVSRYLQRKW